MRGKSYNKQKGKPLNKILVSQRNHKVVTIVDIVYLSSLKGYFTLKIHKTLNTCAFSILNILYFSLMIESRAIDFSYFY